VSRWKENEASRDAKEDERGILKDEMTILH
jgi:hypothetical protein